MTQSTVTLGQAGGEGSFQETKSEVAGDMESSNLIL